MASAFASQWLLLTRTYAFLGCIAVQAVETVVGAEVPLAAESRPEAVWMLAEINIKNVLVYKRHDVKVRSGA